MTSIREAGARGDSVLVVVADRASSESLAGVLTQAGYDVLSAFDPSEAMAVSETRRPSAVVVDDQVGGVMGADLAKQLKQRDPASAVVLLAAPASLEEALSASADLDALLVKPMLTQVFLQSVRHALTVRALKEDNSRLTTQLAHLTRAETVDHPLPEPPDRSQFAERLSTALTHSQSARSPMAVFVVELGGWQTVADRLGPAASEEALASLGSKLSEGRRRSDLVGRVAVDRFAIACADIGTTTDCHRVVRVVLDALEGPVKIDDDQLWLAPRAGAVITDPSLPGQSAEMVLADAEMALVCARDEARPWRLFEKSMLDQVFAREGVGLGIREAMDNDELRLVYHPITDVQTTRVVGAALRLRWMKPQEPILLSSEFLAREGDVALSAQLSAWMLDRAFADLAAWRDAQQLSDDFSLAISVSGRDAADPQFAETVEELMAKHEIAAKMIEIDLSGNAAKQAASSGFALSPLRDRGIRFNLDDFGGAELKLNWLTDIGVSSVKIDPGLIEALDSQVNPRAPGLVRALIALAHDVRLPVTARGVGSSAQRAALLAMGCDLAQYARFGRPGLPGEPWEPENHQNQQNHQNQESESHIEAVESS